MEKPERFCGKRALEEERRGRGSRGGRGRASRGASSPSVRQRTSAGHSGPRGGTLPGGARPREAADGLLLAGRTRPGPTGSFRAEVSEAGPGHAKARPAGAAHLKRINNKMGLVLVALMLRSLRRAWLASIFFLGASARFSDFIPRHALPQPARGQRRQRTRGHRDALESRGEGPEGGRPSAWRPGRLDGRSPGDEMQVCREFGKRTGGQRRTKENFQAQILGGAPFSNAEDTWAFSVLPVAEVGRRFLELRRKRRRKWVHVLEGLLIKVSPCRRRRATFSGRCLWLERMLFRHFDLFFSVRIMNGILQI